MFGGIFTARVLLPQGKGELTAVILWPSLLAAIGNLGIVDAVTYYAAESDENSLKRIFASGLILLLGLAVALVGLGYFILPNFLSHYGPDVIITAQLYLAFIPTNFATLFLMAFLAGRMHLLEFNILRTLVHLLAVTGIVSTALLGWASVRVFTFVNLTANILTLLVAFWLVLRQRWCCWLPNGFLMHQLLNYGWKTQIGSIASLLNLRLDQMLISVLLRPAALGLYAVAVMFSAGVVFGANTIVVVAFPQISNLRSPDEKYLAWKRFLLLSTGLALITSFSLWWLTPWLLYIFFGSAFMPATLTVRWLLVASIPLSLNVILTAGYKAFNQPLVPSQAELIGMGVTSVALFFLLPRYDILGAAWASLLAYSASCVYMLSKLSRSLTIRPLDLIYPTLDDWKYVERVLYTVAKRVGLVRPFAG